jgi:uncharacterized protein YukE
MRAFRVDTDHITGAVDNIEAAVGRLGGAKDMLDGLIGRVSDADSDGKMSDFKDRWKDEFGIVADMLDKFKGALTSAADGYNGADQDMANAWNAPPAPAGPGSGEAV